MLVSIRLRQDLQPITNRHTRIQTWEKAMTAKVTIFGKNS
jgi:hypothetical protein